jgi:two-component system chemotaxis response regulator CheB
MPNHIIVIGASAGGVTAVKHVLANLEPGLTATLFVVIHRSASSPNLLESVLGQTSAMPVIMASDGPIRQGVVYVSPADRHLTIERGQVKTNRGPKENLYRPSIDVLFRSAAFAYRSSVIGLVMTGLLDDGTAGLFYIKRYGGITVVQDPSDAEFKAMPENALANVKIDRVVALAGIAPLLTELVGRPLGYRRQVSAPGYRNRGMSNLNENEAVTPTPFTCPDCHGPISATRHGSLVNYRCLVGHAYGPASMAQAQHDGVERMLWSAAAFLRQRAIFEERNADAALKEDNEKEARRLKKLAAKARRQSQAVETILSDLS